MPGPDFTAIDDVFRLMDRTLWIVAAADGNRRGGLVATWVNQCSIDPAAPLALVGLAPGHFTTELVAASGAFCLHLVASDQVDLAWPFALGTGRTRDKFATLAVTTAATGSPLIVGCLAWLDCRVVTSYDAGDRIYFWADVIAGRREHGGRPLTEGDLLAAANSEEKAALREGMLADRQTQQPLRAAWRERLAAGRATEMPSGGG